jgi:DNA-binding transcriptional LysR family regulator
MQQDLNLIRVLVAVDDHHRVAAAAEELGMTQSGVSNALRRLRAEYDDALFVRSARGMQPTARALPLIDAARQMIDLHKTRMLGQVAFDPAATTTEFRFAMSDIGEMVFLPRILEHVGKLAPRATFRSVVLAPSALTHALEDGQVDLAVGYFPDLHGANVFQQKLFSHGFVCLARTDHPSIDRHLTRKQFLELGHAVIHAEGRSQEVFEQYLRRKRIARRIVLRVPHFMSIPYVIAASDLIVTVPLAVGTAFAAVARLKLLRPPLPAPRFDLKQHWHRRSHKDPRSRWLRAQIASLFNEQTDEWRAIR